MQHGECISTAVRVMDRAASLSVCYLYLHTINLHDCRQREEGGCMLLEVVGVGVVGCACGGLSRRRSY